MNFVKMHGLGNDFVMVDAEAPVENDLVRRLCDRRFGVGADGVLRLSTGVDGVRMEYWNADGSVAEMCGNGLRCIARRAVDVGLADPGQFQVQTPIGPRRVRVAGDRVSVDLGPVTVAGTVTATGYTLCQVDVGNPHAVALTDPSGIDLLTVGPLIEHHPAFPGGTNVEFYVPTGDAAVRMRVWERGVGETLACGTGIVAVAAAARHDHVVSGDVITVDVPGGRAHVDFDDGVWLTGSTETVFEGRWVSGSS